MTEHLGRLWRGYAEKVYGPDYPLYRALARAVADDEELLSFLAGLPGEAHDPNMLMAGVQYLVEAEPDRPLAALFDDAALAPDPREAAALMHSFCGEHGDELAVLLSTHHIQTNETGRCGAIALGLAAAAEHMGEPLGLVDDGASAGLNLNLDAYLLDFGTSGRIGPEDSPVRLACRVTGSLPGRMVRLPAISGRVGIDRAPVDLDDPDAVRWMLACIWPGNARRKRAEAAIAASRGRPRVVRRGDMVEDLAGAIKELRPAPVAVITSWSYSYLTIAERDRFQDVLRGAGEDGPAAWVCCDLLGVVPQFTPETAPPPGPTPSVLGLAVFDGSAQTAAPLAYMHSHGTWLHWL